MLKRNNTNTFYTAFIDVMFLVILGVMTQLVLLLLVINEPTTNEDIEKHAEYILTVEWNNDIDCDIDTWVLTPTGEKVSFQNKERNFLTLERDDLGIVNDVFTVEGERFLNSINEETVVFRGFIPGEYIVNVHMYRCAYFNDGGSRLLDINSDGTHNALDAITVTVELLDINPKLKTLYQTTLKLDEYLQEVTAFRFTLDHEGNFTYDGNLFYPLVSVSSANQTIGIPGVNQ